MIDFNKSKNVGMKKEDVGFDKIREDFKEHNDSENR